MDNQLQGSQHQPMSVGDWLITLIITALPLIGIIMLFVWAFGGDTNPTKANWAKANLILFLIAIVLLIIFFAAFSAFLSAMFSGY